jgi:cytochrome b involved in lipid metabolism
MPTVRTELLIGLLISLIIIGLVFWDVKKYTAFTSPPTPTPSSLIAPSPTSTATPAPSTTLTLTEISKHNSASDCWIIINNKVLKITPFLSLHPGGASTITQYCGKDATAAFNSIKNGSGHSNRAVTMFADFLIGLVGQSVSPAALTPTPGSSYTIPRRENDDD